MPEPTLDDLRFALRVEAEDVDVPVPPLDRVAAGVATARRRRRGRTVLGVLAAAAAVGALVVSVVRADSGTPPDPAGTPTGTPERDLRTLEDLDRGPSTDIAWAIGNKLVLGSRSITFAAPVVQVDQAGDSVLVVLGDSFEVVLVNRLTGERRVLAPSSAGSAAIAPDEGAVAWVKRGEPATVVLRWLGGERDNERVFPVGSGCCDNPFTIDGITATGQLIASSGAGGSWVWDYPRLLLSAPRPGDDVRRIRGLGGLAITDVLGGGIVGTDASDPVSVFRAGPVEGDRFRPEVEVDGAQQAYVDSAGRAVVHRQDGAVVVLDGSDERPLPLPPGSGIQGMIEETETTVLLDVRWSDGSAYELTALVRCDVEELTCEKVANVPTNLRLLF